MKINITKQQVVEAIATGLWVGKLPKTPGTFGSILACVLILILAGVTGIPVLELIQKTQWMLLITIGWYVLGCWATDHYMRAVGKPDPQEVVVDEIAGQWLTLTLVACILPEYLVMQHGVAFFLLSFIGFRIFDMIKIGPVKWADQKLKGAHGVMLDDIFAGIMASIAASMAVYMVAYVS